MADDDIIAVCSECQSDQPDAYIERNPFYKQGGSIPCKFCSGIVIITERGNRDRALAQKNRERGLPT